MDWIPQLEALFSHVVSQWMYRWLPLPESPGGPGTRLDLTTLALADCIDYIESRFSHPLSRLPWMDIVEKRLLSKTALASLVYEQVQSVYRNAAELLDFYHPLYPQMLRYIPDPPNAVTAKGSLSLLNQSSVAMVGSRKASSFALRETEVLARKLAHDGLVIVSGGAIGCDIAGHLGALRSSVRPAPTVIVFAGGLSNLYPSCHRAYFSDLAQAGALFLSERLWNFPARPMDFPARNRIISGIASRVLVMQAAERSGARLTAHCALDQGREVYVMVHPLPDVRALGSQYLLEDGAIPFHSAEDYLSLPALID